MGRLEGVGKEGDAERAGTRGREGAIEGKYVQADKKEYREGEEKEREA